MKNLLLFLMILFYLGMGIIHFVNYSFFTAIMPVWSPFKTGIVILSGIAEVLLALFLIPQKSRKAAAWLIIAMLVVYFFLIHIPMAIEYYQSGNKMLWIAVIRLPVQFLLIWWAWIFTKRASV